MSKTLKLTPWFSADVKPARKGVYHAEWKAFAVSQMHPWFAYWDGRNWGWMKPTKEEAVWDYRRNPDRRHSFGKLAWRGRAVKP